MLDPTLIRTAVAGAALALTLTACSSTTTYDESTYEVEDCDVDDMLEGDSDCASYDDGHSTKKHKATKPKKGKSTFSRPRSSTKSGFGGTRRR
ncbi:hypothetical protein ACFVJS_03955 [Nocardioides sp. NPDC057772]|uniref:hypothetical protein n=1 Tax=Nocardioides sp. NPDC057772 TaxID=3346245 RepID=UPI00366D21E6